MPENTSVITEWSVDGLLDEIRHLDSNMKERSLAFVLGAGASISSGIPAGGVLAKRWLKEIHLRECLKTGETLETWASKKLGVDNFQLHHAATHYAKIFELRFNCDPQSGYAALESEMEDVEPSIGYAILAKILGTTRNKVVVTTNFDNLIADALALQALRAPLIVGHEALTSFINPRLSRPLVAKIHRDLHLHPKNDQNGVQYLEKGWQEALSKLFQHYTPIVIGYGGNDESLMGFLSNLPPKHIPGRLFWCYREGDYPQQRIIDVVSYHQGVLVAIAGFDEFMVQLAQTLFPGFMLATIAKEISDIGKERASRYEELANELMERVAKSDSSSNSIITQQARQSISEAGSTQDKSKWWIWDLKAKAEHNLGKIKAIYEEGIKTLPDSAELHGNYANFLAQTTDEHDKADEIYKIALSLDENSANNIGNYANFLANKRKNYDEAESLYKRALDISPKDAYINGNYANFLADYREDYKSAEIMYKRALKIDPDNANITGNYAHFLANQYNSYDEAKAMYKRAIELEPNNANILSNFANLLTRRPSDYDKAEETFKRAIELAPENAGIAANYATFLANQLGNYDAAEDIYKQATELSPENANIIGDYANFLAHQIKNNNLAETMYKRAIKHEPDNSNILSNYASFLAYNRDNTISANEMYNRAVEIAPNDPRVIGNYAQFLAGKLAQFDKAEVYFKKALEISPNDHNNLANYISLLLIRKKPECLTLAKSLVNQVIKISNQIPSQALAEALLYDCIIDELSSSTVSNSIGRLKTLLDIGYERGIWDFSQVLNACLPKINKERRNFYKKLTDAILDDTKVSKLDDFSWWRNASNSSPFTISNT